MNRKEETCPFCSLPPERVIASCEFAIAIGDKFPVTEGHCLVIPGKHVRSLFDLPPDEQAALWSLVTEVRQHLIERLNVSAFNIGINDGSDAGQTIGHAHIHLIPRRPGDVPDPRGGIRWIIPEKAKYWKS